MSKIKKISLIASEISHYSTRPTKGGSNIFELIILLSRYLFVFYIGYFLILSLQYMLDERNIKAFSRELIIKKQIINIVLMHITGFLIVTFKPETNTFDIYKLIVGSLSLILILVFLFLSKRIYPKSCPLLWTGMFFLMDISTIILARLDYEKAIKQCAWIAISLLVVLIIPFVFKYIKDFVKLKYFYLSFALILIFSAFFLASETFGAFNWIKIFGITFQPSEIVKFLFVFYLAASFSKELDFKEMVLPTVFAGIITLALVSQNDLGGALIFFMTYMVMIYIATGSIPLLLAGLVSFSVASVIAYIRFGHIRTRISIWLDPWADYYGKGYQSINSLFAIGTWGLFGSGLTRGIPTKIPVAVSDFIFSAITEEFGGIFAICLLAIFVVIYFRGVNISLRCNNYFFSLVVAGLTALLAFQTFLIIGGNLNFIPLTGVTLPFVSYGGTSMLSCVTMVGIIQWVYSNYGEEKVYDKTKP